jgi:hypothetical protein
MEFPEEMVHQELKVLKEFKEFPEFQLQLPQ